MTAVAQTHFVLPPGAEAAQPPERRGLARDGVRLLAARPGLVEHRRFRDLPDLLAPGDLLVVNTSATLPAAVDALRPDGRTVPVHVSTALDDGRWLVELRRPDSSGPDLTGAAGEVLDLPGGLGLTLDANPGGTTRLWLASPSLPVHLPSWLSSHGRPVAYSYLSGRFPLSDSQTVFGRDAGSAEMASAGRPFTAELVVRLVTAGVAVAPVLLHTGLSSPEHHEPPLPERFRVPETTARLVNSTREAGGRVVAVGTTVVRALETAAASDGTVRAADGWTDLVLGPDRPARTVTGLVTGLHAPEASHLLLLEAVAGPELVGEVYAAAVQRHYLWHEFGDSSLLLP